MKKARKIFTSIILIAVILYSSTAVSIVLYAQNDQTQKADVAIILGAVAYNGTPSPVFLERIRHGVSLYQDATVNSLIMTGGKQEGDLYSEAMSAKITAIEQGVFEKDIYIEEISTITLENLQQAKIIMDEQHFKTALIVSDPLHMKRAMFLAKAVGIEAYSSPTLTTRYQTWKTQLPFLMRETIIYLGYRIMLLF